MVSLNAQYHSLHFVTFPTLVVFKSAKIVPTMLMNTIVNRVFDHYSDYVLAALISCSVAGFSLIMEGAGGSETPAHTTIIGILLLLLYLVTDALSSASEKKIFTMFDDFNSTQMLLALGACGFCYSIITVVATGGFTPVLSFLHKHPEAYVHMMSLSAFSSAGQWLILYVVRRHGPVVWAIISTVRQIISINISAWLYGHIIGWDAIACATATFIACLAKPIYVLGVALKANVEEADANGSCKIS